MRRWLILILITAWLLTGCTGSATEVPPPADPEALLQESVLSIRETENFRMLLEQTGADFPFSINVEQIPATAVLKRAEAQYITPDVIYANVKLKVGGITMLLDIFAREYDQWWRLTASPWVHAAFAPGFNPTALIAKDSGFQRALSSLEELEYVGSEDLDGKAVYHLRGEANGEVVTDLLVGLIETHDDVIIDVYIDVETKLPSLVVVTHPDTATEQQPEDSAWRVELYDVNGETNIEYPEELVNS